MTASEYARYVFNLMVKAGSPYYNAELDDDIPDVPPQIKVWDNTMQMIRVICFADDEAGAAEALSYARDVCDVSEPPSYYWPEAWWDGEGRKIEGWDEPAPE